MTTPGSRGRPGTTEPELGAWIDTHSPSLLALATALLDDRPAAEEVVCRTLVEASAGRRAETEPEERRDLARGVYAHCAALRRSGGTSPARLGVQVLVRLSYEQRAAIALSLFGGHSYVAVADLVGLPEASVVELQRSGLRRLREAR